MKSGEPIQVLVVEDSRTEARMVSDALEARFASSVDTTDTLALAREMLDARAYDIVILDLKLPGGTVYRSLEIVTR
ncbi:MAG: response regulator [Actinobacteria bacterium]|nr:response regulator [Actinomycetota bacterium]MCG2817831.1 response regulator [Actinomycetes bacterium]MBU4178681.1 response regulator [Actinomycetota bacterium]MBU4217616.1 response regulator [Actinomycetota bacterium]MBU4358062.1 response regulator [Actinomycetota bacterium]